MPSQPFPSRQAGTPPAVRPVLDALDRLQQRPVGTPEAHRARAGQALVERLGPSAARTSDAYVRGATSLLADHTHITRGFALLLPLPEGAAVAVRATDAGQSSAVAAGDEQVWALGEEVQDRPAWVRVVAQLVRRVLPAGTYVDLAVRSAVPAACADAYWASLSLALGHALRDLFDLPHTEADLRAAVSEVLAAVLGRPFSVAYVLAATAQPDHLALVDTQAAEQLSLPVPPPDALGWALIDTHLGALRPPAFYRKRQEQVQEALERLRRRVFGGLPSFRDLEHRDLERALDQLPARYRPVVRHVVTENRRVQRMVVALDKQDWQMLGALMLISHGSMRGDYDSSHALVDYLVSEVQARTIDGLYGATLTDREGMVLVAGRPFVLPQALDAIADAAEAHTGTRPGIRLL